MSVTPRDPYYSKHHRASQYVAPDRIIAKCGKCKKRIRGKGHDCKNGK